MTEFSEFKIHRRGMRVFMRVPVEVRGIATNGSPLVEKAHTVIAGVYGAMVRMSRPLLMGSEVELTNDFSLKTMKFRVVWVKEHEPDTLWEIGVESLGPLDDFWGVKFPAKV